MDWFSEKFMEDCIAEAPEVFLGRPLQLKAQQYKLGGFIPDLIFIDSSGKSVIVEIQKSALDRYHLYKCLEYRDLLANEENSQPIVILVCETLPERYQNIIATHNIELHILDRYQLIEKAIDNCPNTLKNHLLQSPEEYPSQFTSIKPNNLRRYRWNRYDTLADIYSFIYIELGRCGLSKEYLYSAQNSNIFFQARQILDDHPKYEKLLNPTEWRIDNLITKPKCWVPPNQENLIRIRKPKAELYTFITSKGNLSMRWRPKLESRETGAHDWIKGPSTEPYAYQRPEDELLFIKDIHWLTLDTEHYARFENSDDREALTTMLLALIWGMIEHIKKTLSSIVDIDMLNEFQLTTIESADDDHSLRTRYELSGWRLIDIEDLRAEEAERRIEKFSIKNDISIEVVLQTLKEILSGSTRLKGDRPIYLAKALREKGYKITASPLRELINDFKLAKYPAYSQFQDDDS